MYGPIRDLFIHVLSYPPRYVDIDTAVEGGRPDVTARAPSGLLDERGGEKLIDWIVVEAKDERGCFRNPTMRERIFEKKSKYIGTNTAWFVMVEPEIWVARPVSGGVPDSGNDIELPLSGLSLQAFLHHLEALRHDRAGVPEQLSRFRAGDTSLIATEKLDWPDPVSVTLHQANRARVARKRFFQNLREATQSLQTATQSALVHLQPEIETIQQQARAFGERFGTTHGNAYHFNPHALILKSHPQGPEDSRAHDREAARLRREFAKRPHVARLALDGLPSFQNRTGVADDKLLDLFATETANLILARILLLRFFEDHGFFGEIRYVCNGGVQAFQQMRDYFHSSYTRLLEQAYRDASLLYAAAFDATELDWVLGSEYEPLSRAIEWVMFQFSRYDFTTVRGDILSGIYDRFLDRAKRKQLGEFYTPPSVARYIIRRVGIDRNSRILDPACGSGTFLVEAFRELVGQDLDRGVAEFDDVTAMLERLAGNDLNTFSGVLTHIQLLWQILSLKRDIEQHGFPDIRVTSKVNSLVFPDQFARLERFGEIDVPEYTAVIGNPPYVRAERSSQDLDPRSEKVYEKGGVSARRNAYTLFIYRALATWCRPAVNGERPGRLGFIVPISLFDANETADLRRLFRVGVRWTLLEILDLEAIYRDVFDADVLPVIIIAENRPATEDDTVIFRLADKSCVEVEQVDAVPTLHLDDLPEQRIPYPDIFTPDGRIMTRLTPARLAVLSKLWRHPTLEMAAKPYWVRKQGSQIVEAIDTPPPPSTNGQEWEARRMIRGGISFRRQRRAGSSGYDVFKGENILASEFVGDPAARQVDVLAASDPSLWRQARILPERGFAVAQLAHCPNAVCFNAQTMAFTDTATLFFPAAEWREFPFDLLLLSRLYWFTYSLGARMGVLRQFRSHIYPANLRLLPCPSRLLEIQTELEALRAPLVAACRQRFQAKAALREALVTLRLATLKKRMQADHNATVAFSESFETADYEITVDNPGLESVDEVVTVRPSRQQLLDWVRLSREDFAKGVVMALQPLDGEDINKSRLLNLSIPVTTEECQQWETTVARFAEEALITEMEHQLDRLDVLVGAALDLDAQEIAFVQRECREDSFLSRIRPRFPGTDTRRQGFRTGLDSATRYD